MSGRHAATLGIVLLILAAAVFSWADDGPASAPPAEPGPPPEALPAAAPADEAKAEAGDAEEKSQFALNGFIQSQAGLFVSRYENHSDEEGFPREHGGHWGQPSMFRNTLQLEATWQPLPQATLFAMFRGVRSSALNADNFAQVPVFYADTGYNHDKTVQKNKRQWVADTYYQENDLREIYVDVFPTDWWTLRLGRQQVAWGETANARLMDVINPIDSTWHLSTFEAYEDQRIPLWAADTQFEIKAIDATLEGVLVPLIGDAQDRATVPLTFCGAWGLPLPSKNSFVSDLKIVRKTPLYPGSDLEDARWGARWKHVVGPFTYTLMYYHGHNMSPPIPLYAEQTLMPNAQGYREVEVFLGFPRQDTYGLSWELAAPSPVSTIMRFEGAYNPRMPYPVSSFLGPGSDNINQAKFRGWYPSPDNPDRLRADFLDARWDTYSYAVTLMRSNQIRWLNPTSSIITQAQVIQTIIPGSFAIDKKKGIDKIHPEAPYIDEELADGSLEENKNWYGVAIPGYDTTKLSEISTIYALGILTNYFHGLMNPSIIGVYDENNNGGIVSTALDFALGNMWRIKLAYNFIEGEHPYQGLGLFRDRDEVNLRVRCQF